MFLKSSVLFIAEQKILYLATMSFQMRLKMNTYKYLLIGFTCFLTACASHRNAPTLSQGINEPSAQTATTENKKAMSATKVTAWEISGAMAARNKQKGWSASLDWTQQGMNQYNIRLIGPVGGGTVLIAKQGGTVTFTDGPKKVSSHNADELLAKETGIRLPVNNLYYWVRGLQAPGAVQSSHSDANHNLTSLSQSGYTIDYANYKTINNVNLPGKIRLQGHGVLIKLVIKHWNI